MFEPLTQEQQEFLARAWAGASGMDAQERLLRGVALAMIWGPDEDEEVPCSA